MMSDDTSNSVVSRASLYRSCSSTARCSVMSVTSEITPSTRPSMPGTGDAATGPDVVSVPVLEPELVALGHRVACVLPLQDSMARAFASASMNSNTDAPIMSSGVTPSISAIRRFTNVVMTLMSKVHTPSSAVSTMRR